MRKNKDKGGHTDPMDLTWYGTPTASYSQMKTQASTPMRGQNRKTVFPFSCMQNFPIDSTRSECQLRVSSFSDLWRGWRSLDVQLGHPLLQLLYSVSQLILHTSSLRAVVFEAQVQSFEGCVDLVQLVA